MTLSELRLAVGNVTNPRSSTPPLNVIAFSKVAQVALVEYPWVNQKREVRVTTWELAALLSVTFKALRTAPMGLPIALPALSPAKRSPTALLFASTIGEPESPGAPNASEATIG